MKIDNVRLGFIGAGNMGGALASAARRTLSGDHIMISNRTPEKAAALAESLQASTGSNNDVAAWADFLFLGIKPQMMADMLAGIAPTLAARKDRVILVTMAAGLPMTRIQEMAGGDYPVFRIMPNTPCLIGEGMILYTCGPGVTEDEEKLYLQAMQGAGRFSEIPERLMDAGSAVAGCGPAFADLFLEALADGGVACGIPRAQAMEFAVQMLIGTARLMQETGKHPGALKDAVCSPGGSTIQGVRALEKSAFRSAVIEAVIAACEKNAALMQ